ncbi:hypothetical protein [Flavobacterium sp.]|uniref:hypothetical protein n=1 Tax=Flavobacterium sp. TaxID=239 RepID=UPI001225988D|nr:hypothetical protein [Flavobacterium sp.]RZJ70457.1 MAG: hypothetical protein EOO49_13430 [Flavobacterium sp.]
MKKLPALLVLGKGLLLLAIGSFCAVFEMESAIPLLVISGIVIVIALLLFAFLPEKKDGNYF